MARFASREAAGTELAESLRPLTGANPVVVAIPSGGVPVAAGVARALDAPLDVLDVHEVTGRRADLGLGAVDSSGDDSVRASTATALGLSDEELRGKIDEEQRQLRALLDRVREHRPQQDLAGHTVVVVDDSLAVTGAVAAAAVDVRNRGARETILAVPVAVTAFVDDTRELYDRVATLETVDHHFEVDEWYDDAEPITDDDVVAYVTVSDASHTPNR